MDILSKAVNKVGEAAGQAVAAAAFQRQLDGERRALADLRAQAFALRAQIGEEMFKLWQTRTLPPSSLDHLFTAIEQTMAEIVDQRTLLERLMAQRAAQTPSQGALLAADYDPDLIDVVPLPPPPLPAAPTRRLGGAGLPQQASDNCPTCGAAGVTGKPYCGYCGSRLA